MLSTSYQAFYALDTLRDRANLTCRHVACEVMGWDDVQYRAVLRNVEKGAQSGLTGRVDIMVRRAIAVLLFGLEQELLPLPRGRTTKRQYEQRDMLRDLKERWWASSPESEQDDPLGYLHARLYGNESSISTEEITQHARRFSSQQ